MSSLIKTGGFSKYEADAVKGIAILLMLGHHLFYKDATYETYEISCWLLNQDILKAFGIVGKSCVNTFAMLSAYGMATNTASSVQTERVETGERLPVFASIGI